MRISDWSSDVCSSDLYVLASALFSFLNRRKHSEREVGEHILVIDEGTTSTRAMLFDLAGKCLATSQRELTQYYPEPGHVVHDAGEIWDKRSEEHTSELQSLMRSSYAVYCLQNTLRD